MAEISHYTFTSPSPFVCDYVCSPGIAKSSSILTFHIPNESSFPEDFKSVKTFEIHP